MRSLRLRLLLPLGIGLTLLLIVGGAVVFGAVGAALRDGFDEALLEKAQALSLHLELRIDPEQRLRVEALGARAFGGPDGAAADPDARAALLGIAESAFSVHLADRGRLDPAYADSADPAYFEIRLGSGTELARSPSLGGEPRVLEVPPGETRIHFGLTLPDGRRGRAVVLRGGRVPFADEAWQHAWSGIRGSESLPTLTTTVTVAEATTEIDAFLGTLRRSLVGLLGVLVLGGGLVALVFVLRGLAPLNELRRQIDDLDPASLDQRVRLRRPPSELAPVVTALNERLDALEEAFVRERRTTAHIAHELRTPIAELRSLTEVALQFPDDVTLTKQGLEQGHEAAVHMSKIVEAVLRLARARAPREGAEPEPVALAPLVESAWGALRSTAASREQTLEREIADDLVAHADRQATEALIANLLDNAIRHAPAGSAIRVSDRHVDGRILLEIANPCTDLDEADLDRLVEPFWRKDGARSASEQGGLGLALAKAWAGAAGIDLAFTLGEGIFTASLQLPVSRDPPDAG